MKDIELTVGVMEDPFLYGPGDDDLGDRNPNNSDYAPSWNDPVEDRIIEDIDPDMDEHFVKENLIHGLECTLGSKLPNDIWQLSIPQLRKRLDNISYGNPSKDTKNNVKKILNKIIR